MTRTLIFFLLILSLSSCEEPEKTVVIRPVRALQLEDNQHIKIQSFPGRTRAVGRVNLSFRVEGPLIARPAQVGDKVREGDLLARIDPRDFETALEKSMGDLDKALAELRFAKSDYQRSLNIYKQDPGAISQSMLDRKKEDVSRLEGDVKSLTAKVENEENQLSYTYLNSPYEGTIVATYVENFEYVHAKQPIVRLLNNQEVEMIIDVPESLINYIPYVKKVYIKFDALGDKEFLAKVKEIGEEASVTTRTYPVTLLVEQPDNEMILAGMAGHAYLEIDHPDFTSERGFLLPTTALVTDVKKEKSFVWIYDPDTQTVHRQEVTVGDLTSEGIIITEGLAKGMWVVTSGANSLTEGQEVALLPVTLSPQGEQIEQFS